MTYRNVGFRLLLALAVVLSAGLGFQSLFGPGATVRAASAPSPVPCPICNDNNADTFDRCVNGQCVYTPIDTIPATVVFTLEDSGQGSLRAAIEAANNSPADDVITFWVNGTITLTSDELTVGGTGRLTIQGNGASQTIISGNNAMRVFNINPYNFHPGTDVTFNHLTIEKGNVRDNFHSCNFGGAILNPYATVTMNDCTISGNSATGGTCNEGGAIYNSLTLNLTNCTFINNSASGSERRDAGGAIANAGTAKLTNCTLTNNSARGDNNQLGGAIINSSILTLTNCTFSGNSANSSGRGYNTGGAISNTGIVNVINSTLSGNSASGGIKSTNFGGGIFSVNIVNLTNSTLSGNSVSGDTNIGGGICGYGLVNLTNSTIALNSASGGNDNRGGGIFRGNDLLIQSEVNARNTIIALNTANSGPDVTPSLTSQGFNLIGDTSGATINGDETGNIYNQPAQLAPLTNNGGPTQTHALLTNSPARNAGDNCVLTNTCASPNPGFALTTDQRGAGFNRLMGNRVDIGAVEYNAAPTLNAEVVTSAQGSIRNNVLLGLAGDLEQAPETLSVSLTPLTGFGVTLGPLSVDSSGNVKANVSTNCSATTSTFTLKVTDNGTLFEEKPLTVTVNADATRPDTNLTQLPASVSDVDVRFTFSGTDNCTVSGFQCKLDNGGWTSCTSPQSYSNLSSGQHTFLVQAVDARGNVDDTPASYTWTVFAASCGTVVNPVTMPVATKGTPFVQTLSAAPTGSYVFSLLSGQLPPGLNLVNTLGIYSLRGTPNTSGTYTFKIKAAKANSTCAGARSYTINVP